MMRKRLKLDSLAHSTFFVLEFFSSLHSLFTKDNLFKNLFIFCTFHGIVELKLKHHHCRYHYHMYLQYHHHYCVTDQDYYD